MTRRLPFLLFSVALVAASARSFVPCEMQYRAAILAVADAHLQQGAAQKVQTKLVNAWRMARSASDGNALAQVDQASQLLTTGSFKDVSAESKSAIGAAIDQFAACLRAAPALVLVPVTVRVLAPDGTTVAGVPVTVDQQAVGKTGADGTLALSLPEGEHHLLAVQYLDFGGTATATVAAGQTNGVDVALHVGDFATIADCIVDEANGLVVPSDFGSFTLRLLDGDGKTIRLANLAALQLSAAGEITNVAAHFTLRSSGELVADRDWLRAALLDNFGPFDLLVRGTDQQGTTYRASYRFDLGRYRLSGAISVPTGLSSEGIAVRITNQRDNLSFWATTTATGQLAFPDLLPEGAYILHCEHIAGGARYRAFDAFVLDGNKSIGITVTPAVAP